MIIRPTRVKPRVPTRRRGLLIGALLVVVGTGVLVWRANTTAMTIVPQTPVSAARAYMDGLVQGERSGRGPI